MSYSGGMFSDDGFRALFVTALEGQPANYDLRRPLLDPALGAALYAAKHRGRAAEQRRGTPIVRQRNDLRRSENAMTTNPNTGHTRSWIFYATLLVLFWGVWGGILRSARDQVRLSRRDDLQHLGVDHDHPGGRHPARPTVGQTPPRRHDLRLADRAHRRGRPARALPSADHGPRLPHLPDHLDLPRPSPS